MARGVSVVKELRVHWRRGAECLLKGPKWPVSRPMCFVDKWIDELDVQRGRHVIGIDQVSFHASISSR